MERLQLWWAVHDGNRYAEHTWTVVFGGAMLAWPFVALAFGVNVFSSVWYWISAAF